MHEIHTIFLASWDAKESIRYAPLDISIGHPGTFLKGSYDAISSFAFSLECYKLIVHR